MLTYFKAFTVFLLWTIVALTAHYYISYKHFNTCNSTIDPPETITINKDNFFLITDSENTPIYNSSNGFTINQHNASVSSVDDFPYLKDSLQHFLTNDYSKEIHITGKYVQSETNANVNWNLGLQRAESLKKELIIEGIDASKIKTFGKLLNFTYNKVGIYTNGIEIKTNTLQQSLIDSLESHIATKTLYIEFKNDSLPATQNLIDYTLLLKQYSQKHPHKKIQIIGHTDNLGYFQNNLIIGLNRANLLREYFVDKGVDFDKIETLSKGESEPIAEKTTEEGRAKNRRIEIKIN